ncbi:hypothetical protein DFH28DRAFT_314187 [Melampsora americana]|nr:hypothetical protein DFH28DRAFT_314187 [Melampsora americana]
METIAEHEETKGELHSNDKRTSPSPHNLSEESPSAIDCVYHCDVTVPPHTNKMDSHDSSTTDEIIQRLKQRVEELEKLLQESNCTIEALNHLVCHRQSVDGNIIEEFQVSETAVLYPETQEQDQSSLPTLGNLTSHLDGSEYYSGISPAPANQMTEEYEDTFHEDESTSMGQQPTCGSPLPESLGECCTPPYSESYELEEEFSYHVEDKDPMLDSVSAVQKERYPPKIATKTLTSRISRTPSQDFRDSAAQTRAAYRRFQPSQSSWGRFSKSSFRESYRKAASASLRSSNFAMQAAISSDPRDRRHQQTTRPRRLYQETREIIHTPCRTTGHPARQPPIAARISKPTNDRTNRPVYLREHIRTRDPEFVPRSINYAQKRPREYSNGKSHNVRHYDEGWSSHQPTSSSARHHLQRRREYYDKLS